MDIEFKTPRISPILKSAKILPHENKALYSKLLKHQILSMCLIQCCRFNHVATPGDARSGP